MSFVLEHEHLMDCNKSKSDQNRKESNNRHNLCATFFQTSKENYRDHHYGETYSNKIFKLSTLESSQSLAENLVGLTTKVYVVDSNKHNAAHHSYDMIKTNDTIAKDKSK